MLLMEHLIPDPNDQAVLLCTLVFPLPEFEVGPLSRIQGKSHSPEGVAPGPRVNWLTAVMGSFLHVRRLRRIDPSNVREECILSE